MKPCKAFLFFAGIAIFSGCSDTIQQQNSSLEFFAENPTTITWHGDKKDGIQSYQAIVKVYSMNNRKDHAPKLIQTYRMTAKNDNGHIVTRIDFNADEVMEFRSIIYNGKEAVVFNPNTHKVGHRIPLEDSQSPLYRIFDGQSGLSRINLSLIREEARRLSLDMQEETDGSKHLLLLELPPSMIPQNGLNDIVRSRAAFDMAHETLLKTEVIMAREDGTIVTTTVTPMYEEKDGELIKIGQVTVIDSQTPYLIEGIDPNIEIFNSPDDIPTLTESELAQLQAEGDVHEMTSITFGDPADLSYVETIYEVYYDIEINATTDDLFRLFQK